MAAAADVTDPAVGRGTLSALTDGALAAFRGGLTMATVAEPPAVEVVDGRRLADDGVLLARLVDRFACAYPGARRAQAALWLHLYACAVMPPAAATTRILGVTPDWRLDNLAVHLDASGAPVAVALRKAADLGAAEGLARLIEGNIAPLATALRRAAGLSPTVSWGVAGGVYAWARDRVGSDGPAPRAAALRDADRLAAVAAPLARAVLDERVSGHDGVRWRRTCCLRYALDGFATCVNCPLRRKAVAGGQRRTN